MQPPGNNHEDELWTGYYANQEQQNAIFLLSSVLTFSGQGSVRFKDWINQLNLWRLLPNWVREDKFLYFVQNWHYWPQIVLMRLKIVWRICKRFGTPPSRGDCLSPGGFGALLQENNKQISQMIAQTNAAIRALCIAIKNTPVGVMPGAVL